MSLFFETSVRAKKSDSHNPKLVIKTTETESITPLFSDSNLFIATSVNFVSRAIAEKEALPSKEVLAK